MLFILYTCISCTYINKSEEIIKRWEVASIQVELIHRDSLQVIEETVVEGRKPSTAITFEFKADSSYSVTTGNHQDDGTWGMSRDEKVLFLKSHNGTIDDKEFLIEGFTKNHIILSTKVSGKKEIITLVPSK